MAKKPSTKETPIKKAPTKKTSTPRKKAAKKTPPDLPPITKQDVLELVQKPDAIPLAHVVHQLWQRWGDFELTIVDPIFPTFDPPHILLPEPLPNSHEVEFVYPIHDYGYKFTTSKQEELFSAGLSMCKLYYTIEKIIALLVARLKDGGIAIETEVQVAFSGNESSQRKGFEAIINLPNNVVVINFEPGPWGERYLDTVKRWADKGYGSPTETPRDVYRRSYGGGTPRPK